MAGPPRASRPTPGRPRDPARLRDRRPHAPRPDGTVPRQDVPGLGVLEAGQRRDRGVHVGRRGGCHHARPDPARVGVERDERVPDDHRVPVREVQRHVPVRVPGRLDDPRGPGDLCAARERQGVRDPGDGRGTGEQHPAQGCEPAGVHGDEPEAVRLRPVRVRVRGEVPVARVDVHRRAPLPVHPGGGPDVVEVPVREQQALDPGRRVPELVHREQQVRPGGGEPRVDHEQSVTRLDQVGVRVRDLEAVDPLGDVPDEHGLHRRPRLLGAVPGTDW